MKIPETTNGDDYGTVKVNGYDYGYDWWYQPQYRVADYKITIIEEYEKGELIKKTEIREPVYR